MAKYSKKLIVLLITLVILVTTIDTTFAQYSTNFKNITIKDGLTQSTVQIIFQDSKGYIWLGTNDGLNRYNGYKIKTYKSDEEEDKISDNYILNITEDNKNNLWVSTVNGLNKINIENWEITTYFEGADKGNLLNNFVNATLVTKDGNILVGTANGINIYNEEDDSFEPLLKVNNSLSSKDIKSLAQDNNGNIWVGTKAGLNKIDVKKNTIEQKYEDKEIYSILPDVYGYVWVSTPGYGVMKININNDEIKHYINIKDDEESLPNDYVRKMHQDKSGDIWLATEFGLARYSQKDGKFYTYKNKSYDQNSLINDFVYSVIEDKSGLIWAGTYSGVSVFDPNNKIEHYKNNPFDDNSLSDNTIHGIYEDDEGLLWVGTQRNGLNIIDRNLDKVTRISEGISKYELSSNKIKVITGKDNKIFIGTKDGLNVINKDDMTVKVYTSKDNLAGDNIKSLFLDSKDCLWIGTPDGLSILNTKDDTITNLTYVFSNNNITDTYVEDVFEDKDGNYWIGTFLGGGLLYIDTNKKEMEVFDKEELMLQSNSSMNAIRCINEDNNNNLWIGTSYGLVKLNKKTNEVKTYTKEDGLNNNTVYGVLIDGYGNPWMSTNDGISMLDINTETFINLDINDGLQSNEFNGKAYFKSKRGELFFGGINGLNIFNPDKILKKEYIPSIVFDKFEVEGVGYSNIDNLSFKYNENMVRIKYFVPNYSNNDDIIFEYRLQGLSDEWISLSSNEVIFSKLDPGKYKFSIRYSSQMGVTSEVSSIKFTIKPPFWKSNFALFIYIILIILLIDIVRNRMKTLDKLVNIRTKQLSTEMEKSNKLLNQVIKLERNKNNYFVNLSHELRTPLNVISSIEQLVTQFNKSSDGIDRDKLDYYMSIMKKNTKRLLNLINNIIDTNKIEHGSYKINMDLNDIVYIVEEAALGMKDYIESSGIELIIDTDVEEKLIPCDYDEIERCIVNLVSNAAKFTPSGGSIEVCISDLGKTVKITVKDTGVGIDEKFHKSIFDRFNQVVDSSTETKGGSGLGLTITKHIIDLHNGNIFVESEKNKGSKFTIILPVER